MPNKPQQHRLGSGLQKKHDVQAKEVVRKRYESDRGSSAARGYGASWRKIRLNHLSLEPLCRFCIDDNLTIEAKVVDHIDGNSSNCVRSNLRSLCTSCHNRRTARDQGYGRTAMYMPYWIKPAVIPTTIVCGPPASGKNYYIEQKKGTFDLVIDMDLIVSRISGAPVTHDWDRDLWLKQALRERNGLIGELARDSKYNAAWVIMSEPVAKNRQWWDEHLKPIDIIVMEVDKKICLERVEGSKTRSIVSTREAINTWWNKYERRTGDKVMDGTDV